MRKQLVLLIVLCFVLTSLFPITTVLAVTQATYYVSPAGNDTTGDGSISNPWQTIQKARDVIRTVNSNMTGDISGDIGVQIKICNN